MTYAIGEPFFPATPAIFVALRILAVRAAATGMAPDLMRVMPFRHEDESPFNELLAALNRYIESPQLPDLSTALHAIILQCKLAADVRMPASKISVCHQAWCSASIS